MRIIADLGRVVASESGLPSIDQLAAEPAASPLTLMVAADLHWRRREWDRAIELAKRVLARKPDNFHALSILAGSYGHLGEANAAYPYAKRLVGAKQSNWLAVKLLCAILGVFNFLLPSRRERFYRALRRCDAEATADQDILAWAQELISKHEAENDPIAV